MEYAIIPGAFDYVKENCERVRLPRISEISTIQMKTEQKEEEKAQ